MINSFGSPFRDKGKIPAEARGLQQKVTGLQAHCPSPLPASRIGWGSEQGCLPTQAQQQLHIPQNLSCIKGPPGHQILSIQQHTALRAHKQQVLTSFPWDIHQVANCSSAKQGVGADICGLQDEPLTETGLFGTASLRPPQYSPMPLSFWA